VIVYSRWCSRHSRPQPPVFGSTEPLLDRINFGVLFSTSFVFFTLFFYSHPSLHKCIAITTVVLSTEIIFWILYNIVLFSSSERPSCVLRPQCSSRRYMYTVISGMVLSCCSAPHIFFNFPTPCRLPRSLAVSYVSHVPDDISVPPLMD
jgi:hypothetical protein